MDIYRQQTLLRRSGCATGFKISALLNIISVFWVAIAVLSLPSDVAAAWDVKSLQCCRLTFFIPLSFFAGLFKWSITEEQTQLLGVARFSVAMDVVLLAITLLPAALSRDYYELFTLDDNTIGVMNLAIANLTAIAAGLNFGAVSVFETYMHRRTVLNPVC